MCLALLHDCTYEVCKTPVSTSDTWHGYVCMESFRIALRFLCEWFEMCGQISMGNGDIPWLDAAGENLRPSSLRSQTLTT